MRIDRFSPTSGGKNTPDATVVAQVTTVDQEPTLVREASEKWTTTKKIIIDRALMTTATREGSMFTTLGMRVESNETHLMQTPPSSEKLRTSIESRL